MARILDHENAISYIHIHHSFHLLSTPPLFLIGNCKRRQDGTAINRETVQPRLLLSRSIRPRVFWGQARSVCPYLSSKHLPQLLSLRLSFPSSSRRHGKLVTGTCARMLPLQSRYMKPFLPRYDMLKPKGLGQGDLCSVAGAWCYSNILAHRGTLRGQRQGCQCRQSLCLTTGG